MQDSQLLYWRRQRRLLRLRDPWDEEQVVVAAEEEETNTKKKKREKYWLPKETVCRTQIP
jgi:hypothetical protein